MPSQTFYKSKAYGFLLVIIATALWSNKAIFVKFAYRYGVDPTTLLCLRMLFSLPFYLGVLWMFKRQQLELSSSQLFKIGVIGTAGYFLASLLDLHALSYISVGLERMILYTYPAIVLLLTAFVYKSKIQLKELIALCVAFVGIVIMFYQDLQANSASLNIFGYEISAITFGALLCLFASISFAIYLVGSERWIQTLGSRHFTALSMIAASIGIVTYFLITRPLSDLGQPLPVYGYALAIAFFSTVLPSFMTTAGIAIIGAKQASLIGFFGPVTAILAAYIFLGEALTIAHWIGMLVVMFGLFIITRNKKK